MGINPDAKRIDVTRPLRNLYLIFLVGVVLALGHYFFQGKESFLQVLLIQVFIAVIVPLDNLCRE